MINRIKRRMIRGWNKEEGITTIEVVLVLVILIALVLIFKKQILGIINSIFMALNKSIGEVF